MKGKAGKSRGESTTTKKATSGPAESRFLTSAEFAEAEYSRQWLVRSILLPGQPAVLGGPKKCLKTSLALDLAISLGSGTNFLGRFKVPEPVRVAVISGESGGAVVQETARRIAGARKVDLSEA